MTAARRLSIIDKLKMPCSDGQCMFMLIAQAVWMCLLAESQTPMMPFQAELRCANWRTAAPWPCASVTVVARTIRPDMTGIVAQNRNCADDWSKRHLEGGSLYLARKAGCMGRRHGVAATALRRGAGAATKTQDPKTKTKTQNQTCPNKANGRRSDLLEGV